MDSQRAVVPLSGAIKEHALAIGFDAVGIVRAEALTGEERRLNHWLGLGFAGDMQWMHRTADRRSDPALHMPEVKSIVCTALNYYTNAAIEDSAGRGKVSRYAWGEDYHEVLGNKLRALLTWIQGELPGCRGKIAVDSSPVMDKVWAAKAGLGWIGKHSNLIHPRLGSWVFLGELLLDVELDFDSALVPDQCGTCTLCLEACPTGAIVEPYVVDARRCISYQTIELRSEKLEVDPDGWVYGCDVCQDVCPWNQTPIPTREAAFEPRPEWLNPELERLAGMTEEEFRSGARRSAIKRTKHRGIVRNARAVLVQNKKGQVESGDKGMGGGPRAGT